MQFNRYKLCILSLAWVEVGLRDGPSLLRQHCDYRKLMYFYNNFLKTQIYAHEKDLIYSWAFDDMDNLQLLSDKAPVVQY